MILRSFLSAAALSVVASAASAATVFGPTFYTSTADIPAGFYAGGSPTFLDDFEDGSLDGGITANTGGTLSSGSLVDSVDADDGAIDGSGSTGTSYFALGTNLTPLIFTFAQTVTAAGFVWTDGNTGGTTVKAFDGGGAEIASFSGSLGSGNVFNGQTDEDVFIGFTFAGGIGSISIAQNSQGLEIDHLQYGDMAMAPVPVPASLPLMLAGLGLLVGLKRRMQ